MPPPDLDTEPDDPRRPVSVQSTVHHIATVDGPTEDRRILELSFHDDGRTLALPSYVDTWRDVDHSAAFPYHERILRMLHSHRPPLPVAAEVARLPVQPAAALRAVSGHPVRDDAPRPGQGGSVGVQRHHRAHATAAPRLDLRPRRVRAQLPRPSRRGRAPVPGVPRRGRRGSVRRRRPARVAGRSPRRGRAHLRLRRPRADGRAAYRRWPSGATRTRPVRAASTATAPRSSVSPTTQIREAFAEYLDRFGGYCATNT